MDNLYIVESPLQALCALDISLSKQEETHGIIVRVSDGKRIRNDQQILSIVNKRNWDYLYVMNNIEPKLFLLRYMYIRKTLKKIKSELPHDISQLYLGEFKSTFMHRVRCAFKTNKVFLIDDGTATIQVAHKYLSKNIFYPEDIFFPKNKYRAFIHRFFYYRILDFNELNKRINLLTAYDKIDYEKIDLMCFSGVKNLLKRERSLDNSMVYYYGSKYSESSIISQEYEIYCIKKITEFYREKEKRVIYFAHRDESPEKLKIIESELGVEISIPDKAAEIYLLESSVLPTEIASAISSVLVNTSILFPEVNLQSFRFSSAEISERTRFNIEMKYDYLIKSGIPLEYL